MGAGGARARARSGFALARRAAPWQALAAAVWDIQQHHGLVVCKLGGWWGCSRAQEKAMRKAGREAQVNQVAARAAPPVLVARRAPTSQPARRSMHTPPHVRTRLVGPVHDEIALALQLQHLPLAHCL